MPGADAAGQHQRGQHRAELLDHRRADQPADDRPGAELVERHAALRGEHRAGEEPRQQHDGQRRRRRSRRTARRCRGGRTAAEDAANVAPIRRTYSCTSSAACFSRDWMNDHTRRHALRAGRGSPSSGLRRRLILSRSDAAFSKSRLAAAARISSCSDAM